MKVSVSGRKTIKPCKPTDESLRSYKISLMDELSPCLNVPLVLFYSHGNPTVLEESLALVLPHFYPLAGRYDKQIQTVHCNDQGAEFVNAQADCGLLQLIQIPDSGQFHLFDLLPCEAGAVDEITDPLLSIQVTEFKCGGIAIGICVSHRVFDAASLSTFVASWATNTATINHPHDAATVPISPDRINPSFDSVKMFPGRNLAPLDRKPSRTRNLTSLTTRVLFDTKTINSLRDRLIKQNDDDRVSRVRIVSAFLAEALLAIDRTHDHGGRRRDCSIAQAVNVRGRTVPPIPKHSCGNLVAQAIVGCEINLGFEDYVSLLGEATQRTVSDCEGVALSESCAGKHEEEGHGYMNAIIESKVKIVKRIKGGEVNVVWISDWSKFGFYGSDFGWGKPEWVHVGIAGADNLVVLMDTKDGDGIEASVHLHEKYIHLLPQLLRI